MRKKTIAVFMLMTLIAILVACGNNKEEQVMQDSSQTEILESEGVQSEIMEAEISKEKIDEAEKVEGEKEYVEQRDIFVCKDIDIGNGEEIDMNNKENILGPFIFTESIDIYSYFLTYAGYTKPNIEIHSVGKVGDWIFVPFAQSSFLVKADDFDRVAVLKDEEEIPNNQSAISTQPVNENPDENEPSTDNSIVEKPIEEVPVSNKYTPEEAVAVWSGILNENGMIYDPSIKEFASWGTGWIYLEKGMPEEAAQQDLLGYAYGDGVGNSATRYYYEITGYDEDMVYLTRWSCS